MILCNIWKICHLTHHPLENLGEVTLCCVLLWLVTPRQGSLELVMANCKVEDLMAAINNPMVNNDVEADSAPIAWQKPQEQWELLPSGFLRHRPTGMCVPLLAAKLSMAGSV